MSSLRTFVAIELDEGIRHQIERNIRQISKLNQNFQPSLADQLHLTLCFLGDVELNEQHRVSRIVAQAMDGVGSFTLDLQGVGAFPHWEQPRVIWLGVREPGVTVDSLSEAARQRLGTAAWCPELTDLQSRLVQRFLDQRFWPDTKPFRPHLTLGRVKGGKGAGAVQIPEAVQRNLEQGLGSVAVEEIKILSSESGPQGPIYRTMSTVTL